MIKQFGFVVLMAVASLSIGTQAKAQCGGGFYGGGYNFWDSGRLYGILSQNVPYYSAFPPVYYSVPVARTYGYSPFAYPPGVMTPEIDMSAAAPLEINNPYVVPASSSTTEENSASDDRVTKTKTAIEPLVVANPYVVSHIAKR
ncbi:hypothetical protein [Bythopirellula goksoeyrii]|uniref:Uncharacterized protein n=1 Tax=Bythopirellula goksoeyrii TaxID=1400387 RepID=A0A5B9QCV4_9BACT|nr:hypothetical protein [Bythopirellula goksoeyrii]QEG35629.1 hypothetical protein Pr1d_29310 [Bythopirellula goksoeyrii]